MNEDQFGDASEIERDRWGLARMTSELDLG